MRGLINSPLELAKDLVTIPDLWLARGWDGVPPREGKACRFPDGTDKHPSSSLLKSGMLLHDHRDGKTYNSISLLMAVEGLDRGAACRALIEVAGTDGSLVTYRPIPRKQEPDQERRKPSLPTFAIPRGEEIHHLSTQRHLSPDALKVAVGRGYLRSWDSEDGRAWVLTDSSGWIALARRMDGNGWVHHNGSKAKMLKGSMAAWPIGVTESLPFPGVAICEGGPDMLACIHFLIASGQEKLVAPVCMGSSGVRIPEEALMFFRGKRVRIFIDNDPKGLEASTRWAAQLVGVGCTVDGFDFSGLIKRSEEPVKDLNDCSQLSDESISKYGSLLSGMMDFIPKQGRPEPKPIPYVPPEPRTPQVVPVRYWNAEELSAIQGNGLEGDKLIELLAKQFNARILINQIRQLSPEELYASGGSSSLNTSSPCPA